MAGFNQKQESKDIQKATFHDCKRCFTEEAS